MDLVRIYNFGAKPQFNSTARTSKEIWLAKHQSTVVIKLHNGLKFNMMWIFVEVILYKVEYLYRLETNMADTIEHSLT